MNQTNNQSKPITTSQMTDQFTETPRSALVTGASRGIGKAVALRLAARGHKVAVNYNTHPEEAAAVVQEIRDNGGTATSVAGSVASKEGCEQILAAAAEAHGNVEILINNAGVISDSLMMRMKDDAWLHTLNTNLNGTYYCTRLAIPDMVRARWGRIVNVSSVVGLRGNAGQANYSASKAAIHGLTYSIAKEIATRNVTVNVVAPGYVDTATSNVLTEAQRNHVLQWIPMGRFGTPDEIAPTIVFLTSEEARYITGEVIRVDGGMAI